MAWEKRAAPDMLAALRRILDAVDEGDARLPAAIGMQASAAVHLAEALAVAEAWAAKGGA